MITETKNNAGSLSSPFKAERTTRKNTLNCKTNKITVLKSGWSAGEPTEQHPGNHAANDLYYLDESNEQIVVLQPEIIKGNLDPMSKFIYSLLLEAGELIEVQPQTYGGETSC